MQGHPPCAGTRRPSHRVRLGTGLGRSPELPAASGQELVRRGGGAAIAALPLWVGGCWPVLPAVASALGVQPDLRPPDFLLQPRVRHPGCEGVDLLRLAGRRGKAWAGREALRGQAAPAPPAYLLAPRRRFHCLAHTTSSRRPGPRPTRDQASSGKLVPRRPGPPPALGALCPQGAPQTGQPRE